jgi:anti-sigma factor ChrR (cupin superfamily)
MMKPDDANPEGADDLEALQRAGALPSAEQPGLSPEGKSYDRVVCALAEAAAPVPPPPRIRAALLARIAEDRAVPAGLYVSRAGDGGWEAGRHPGTSRRVLYVDRERQRVTLLLRMEPNATYPAHDHPDVEECYVLEGELRLGGMVFGPGDYQRHEAGTGHEVQTTESGCVVLLTLGLAALSG